MTATPARSRPLHVGLNLMYLEPDSGGSGTYARELIRALHAVAPGIRITAWIGLGAPQGIEATDFGGPVEWVRLRVKSTGSPVHVPIELLLLGLDARRRGVDVVHGLAYTSPVLAPGVATVVTLLDLTWLHHPESVTPLARRMFGLLAPLCGRTADRVVAISQTVRDDLIRTLGLDAGKVGVTLLGVGSHETQVVATSQEALRATFGIAPGAPIVLCVAQLSAHKNLMTLVDALACLAHDDAVLVVPGRRTAYAEELEARVAAAGLGDRVALPGFVSAEELEGLYAAADVFVLPSTLEGFGLPLLEAMRRGVPVACSDASALPEIAGDAALVFDPYDPAAIARAIDAVLEDPALRDDLVRRGRARAAEMTWERTAEATLEIYRQAIDSRAVR